MMRAGQRLKRADEYARLAEEAEALAGTSLLDHVREKHERAASCWRVLAADAVEPRVAVRHVIAS